MFQRDHSTIRVDMIGKGSQVQRAKNGDCLSGKGFGEFGNAKYIR